MTNHEVAFTEMKNYYNDITRENLDLIRKHKERLADFRAKIDANQKSIDTLKDRMEELKVPLSNARKDRDNLKKKLQTYDKNKMALTNARARLDVLRKKVEETRESRIELDKKFEKVEKEKQDMYHKYELAIEQLRQKADYKNTVLDERLEVLQNELDRKEGQLQHLVQMSGLDQGTIDDICKKMEEAIEAKNSILRNLKYSLAHATKAYNDAIRVYEAKLIEFGIPPEELGLELLGTVTSTMPAGLVAA